MIPDVRAANADADEEAFTKWITAHPSQEQNLLSGLLFVGLDAPDNRDTRAVNATDIIERFTGNSKSFEAKSTILAERLAQNIPPNLSASTLELAKKAVEVNKIRANENIEDWAANLISSIARK